MNLGAKLSLTATTIILAIFVLFTLFTAQWSHRNLIATSHQEFSAASKQLQDDIESFISLKTVGARNALQFIGKQPDVTLKGAKALLDHLMPGGFYLAESNGEMISNIPASTPLFSSLATSLDDLKAKFRHSGSDRVSPTAPYLMEIDGALWIAIGISSNAGQNDQQAFILRLLNYDSEFIQHLHIDEDYHPSFLSILTDSRGYKVLTSLGEEPLSPVDIPSLKRLTNEKSRSYYLNGQLYWRVSHSIATQSGYLHNIWLWPDAKLSAGLNQSIKSALVFGFLAIFAIALILLLLTWVMVLSPLRQIARTVNEAEPHGTLRNSSYFHMLSHRKDDLGTLTRSLTGAFQRLEQSRQKELEILCFDQASGVYSKEWFFKEMSKREQYQGVIVTFRVGNLAKVNVSEGSRRGDQFIRLAANTIKRQCSSELIGRIASSTFACLLPDQSVEEGRKRLTLCISEIKAAFSNFPSGLLVNYSAGIAGGDFSAETLENSLYAMKTAKTQGKNICVFDSELRQGKLLRSTLAREIKCSGFSGLRFTLQPQYLGHDLKLHGFEILTRYHSASLGEISPRDFIPAFVSEGEMVNFDLAVTIGVFDSWKAITAVTGTDIQLSINLSPLTFSNSQVVQQIIEMMKDHHVPAEKITLEMTETEVTENTFQIANNFVALAEAGFRLSLDDFGTGYSTLEHLRTLHYKEVKIDQSFVTEIETEEGRELIEGISGLLTKVTDTVVVEGIETQEQFDYFSRRHPDFILQGYFLSRAVDLDDLLQPGALQTLLNPLKKNTNLIHFPPSKLIS